MVNEISLNGSKFFLCFLSPCHMANIQIPNNTYLIYLDSDSVRFSDSNGIFTGNTDGIIFNSNRSVVATMYLGEDVFLNL